MIVKNEAHVIKNALNSVINFIDSWIIVDTGSTDETEAIVKQTLGYIDGKFINHDWKGFGDARTKAFEEARKYYSDSYALVLDGDESIEGNPKDETEEKDSYNIFYKGNGIKYVQSRLFNLSKKWKYVGILHEYPTCDDNNATNKLTSSFGIKTTSNGNRSKNPNKYLIDAITFKTEMLSMDQSDPLFTRYQFYYAQSLRDAKKYELAAEEYIKRSKMGAGLHYEEIYISLLEAGRAYNMIGKGDLALKTLYEAYWLWPARIEACKELASIFKYRTEQNPRQGTLFVET